MADQISLKNIQLWAIIDHFKVFDQELFINCTNCQTFGFGCQT